jgi:hypothetical protein
MLEYPLKVRPMPGIWVQSVPVTAIPWGGMNTEQRNTLQRSIRGQDDWLSELLINASTMRLVTQIQNLVGVNNFIFECE